MAACAPTKNEEIIYILSAYKETFFSAMQIVCASVRTHHYTSYLPLSIMYYESFGKVIIFSIFNVVPNF